MEVPIRSTIEVLFFAFYLNSIQTDIGTVGLEFALRDGLVAYSSLPQPQLLLVKEVRLLKPSPGQCSTTSLCSEHKPWYQQCINELTFLYTGSKFGHNAKHARTEKENLPITGFPSCAISGERAKTS